MSNGKRGGQPGNTNAANAKMWTAAIQRALDKRTKLEGKEAIDQLAENLLKLCDEDNLPALREFGDRMEGKPAQSLTVGGDEDNPLKTINEVLITPLADESSDSSDT